MKGFSFVVSIIAANSLPWVGQGCFSSNLSADRLAGVSGMCQELRGVARGQHEDSAHGKGHEEGGLAYPKAWSSLRKPPVSEHLTAKPESVLCSHLHL